MSTPPLRQPTISLGQLPARGAPTNLPGVRVRVGRQSLPLLQILHLSGHVRSMVKSTTFRDVGDVEEASPVDRQRVCVSVRCRVPYAYY